MFDETRRDEMRWWDGGDRPPEKVRLWFLGSQQLSCCVRSRLLGDVRSW